VTRIISIDPGFAHIGLARWTVRRWEGPGSWASAPSEAKLGCLAACDSFVSNSKRNLPSRLRQIADWLGLYFHDHDPSRIIVEMPAVEGAYAERKSRQRSKSQLNAGDMAAFNRALGVILLTAAQHVGSDRVEVVPASRMPKSQRHAILRGMLDRAVDVPAPANEHQRDAVWVGLTAPWVLPR
jgi:Holliday junction resolvasome RuvABC endonuclease subunit